MDAVLSNASFKYDNLKCYFEMMFKVTEFVSVNSAHGINVHNKVVFDQPWLTRFKSEMADQLIITDPKRYCHGCTY